MWIFTGGDATDAPAFMSAVQHYSDPNILVVRTRDEISAAQLAAFTGTEVIQKDYSDYPFRVFVTKEQMKAYLVRMVDGLDYGNFKSHVAKKRIGPAGRKWSTALHDVWDAMCRIAPRQPYSAIDGSQRVWKKADRGGDYAALDDWLRKADETTKYAEPELITEHDAIEDDDQLITELRAEERRLLGLCDQGLMAYDEVYEHLLLIEDSLRDAEAQRADAPAEA